MNGLSLKYTVPGDDFTRAEASSSIKNKLKQMGVAPDIVRRAAIVTYEGEINTVIHANGGEIFVGIDSSVITIVIKDQGKGIENIELAMREGYTTARMIFVLLDSVREWDFPI